MPTSSSPARYRRWPWVVGTSLLVAIGVVAGGLVLVLYRYTRPARIQSLAESYLSQFTSGAVRVRSGKVTWPKGIQLDDVAMFEPAREEGSEKSHSAEPSEVVFSCRQVELAPRWWDLLRGRLTIHSVTAHEPRCVIVRDAATGQTNLADVVNHISSLKSAGTVSLPVVELRDARVNVLDREGGTRRPIEELTLTLRARASDTSPRYYDIVWQGGGEQIAEGYSQLDLTSGRIRNVHGGMPWMSLRAVMIAVNARFPEAGSWSDLLGMDGEVRACDYNFDGGDNDVGPRSATIDLLGTSLSVPVDDRERDLPADQRYLRFEDVDGRVELTARGLTATFEGRWQGARCQVSARLAGGADLRTLDDVDLDVHLAVWDLKLPRPDDTAPAAHRRFIDRWPRLASFYRDYDPSGPVDVELEATKRAGREEPLVLQYLRLTAKGLEARCRFFPYCVTNVTGNVEFRPEGILLRDICGEHGRGTVSLDGFVEAPNRCARAELSVQARGVPLDSELLHALKPRYRRIVELFNPSGRLDADVRLLRPACIDGQHGDWHEEAAVAFFDASAAFRDLPYPLHDLSGTLRIAPGHILLEDITGRAGEAKLDAQGAVRFKENLLDDLNLEINVRGLKLDETLLSSLPEAVAAEARKCRFDGRADVFTVLRQGPQASGLDHRSRIVLDKVQMTHTALPIPIHDFTGYVEVAPDGLTFRGLEGRHGQAKITADGDVTFLRQASTTDAGEDLGSGAPPDRFKANLNVRADDLLVDDALIAVLPPRLQQRLGGWRASGPLSLDVRLTAPAVDGTAHGPPLAGVIHLRGATISHPRFPVPLRDVRGTLSFDAGHVSGSDVRLRYGGAAAQVNGVLRADGAASEGEMSLTATGLELDESVRSLAPAGVRRAWDALALSGRTDLRIQSLRFRRESPNLPSVVDVDATAELRQVEAPALAQLSGLSGRLRVQGSLADELRRCTLSGALFVDAANVFGRRLTNVQGSWSYAGVAGGQGRLAFGETTGELFGGRLSVHGEMRSANDRLHYELGALADHVDLHALLNAAARPIPAEVVRSEVRGRVSARLNVSGVVTDATSRRGTGSVSVTEGELYRLPLVLAILQVLHFSVPSQEAFNQASFDFYVVANKLLLERLELSGPAATLVGAGSMSLPDGGLDLSLVNVSPHDWAPLAGLASFVEGASRELVELHVTGPLRQPTVRARPFRGVQDELRGLFKKRKPTKLESASR